MIIWWKRRLILQTMFVCTLGERSAFVELGNRGRCWSVHGDTVASQRICFQTLESFTRQDNSVYSNSRPIFELFYLWSELGLPFSSIVESCRDPQRNIGTQPFMAKVWNTKVAFSILLALKSRRRSRTASDQSSENNYKAIIWVKWFEFKIIGKD